MTGARVGWAVLLGVLSTAVCWTGLDVWAGNGGNPPPLTWAAVAGTVALVVVVIGAGLPVRRWLAGRRDRRLDPIVAARTAVLAKAAAYGGPLLAGWYLAQALALLPDLVGVRRERFVVALVAAAAAVAVCVAGFVVQRWCRLPPDDPPPGRRDADLDSVP